MTSSLTLVWTHDHDGFYSFDLAKTPPSSFCIFIFHIFSLADDVYHLQDCLYPSGRNTFRAHRQWVKNFRGNGVVEVVQASGLGLTGKIAQVGLKVFGEGRKGSEAWISVPATMNAEEIT